MPVHTINKRAGAAISSWMAVLACMGFIFYSSSLAASNIPSLFTFQDVVYHLFIYTALGFFFSRALVNSFAGVTASRLVIYTILLGVIYGLTDEYHQLFVPGRICSGMDLILDGSGAFLGSLLYRWRK